jgi:hypothetical protein
MNTPTAVFRRMFVPAALAMALFPALASAQSCATPPMPSFASLPTNRFLPDPFSFFKDRKHQHHEE